MGVKSQEIAYQFGQMGSGYLDDTGALTPPTGTVIVAITVIAAAKFTTLTADTAGYTASDGSTGTDNLALESGTVVGNYGISLESGTGDSTSYDNLVLEDDLASRRSISSIAAEETLPTDAGAFNLELETDADGIIDFSESNPFGEST